MIDNTIEYTQLKVLKGLKQKRNEISAIVGVMEDETPEKGSWITKLNAVESSIKEVNNSINHLSTDEAFDRLGW